MASKSAAKRYGFVYEAVFQQEVLAKNEVKDCCQYSMIDKDWLINKQVFEKWLEVENFDENLIQKERMIDIRKRLELEQNRKYFY